MGKGGKTVVRQETRHVLDRTLGTDVIFVSGSYKGFRQQVELRLWKLWANDAKRIKRGRSIVTNKIRSK